MKLHFEQSIQTEQSSLSENVLERKTNAPKIHLKKIKSLDELIEDNGGTLEQLINSIQTALNVFISRTERMITVEEDFLNTLDVVYQLFKNAENLDVNTGNELNQAFKNQDSFLSYLNITASVHAKSWLSKHIEWFIREKVKNEAFFDISILDRKKIQDGVKELSSYDDKGQYILLPSMFDWAPEDLTYIDPDICNEIAELIELGYQSADMSHTTGSLALSGISAEKKLISSHSAAKLGKEILTGEYVSMITQGLPSGAELKGVYVAKSNPLEGYTTIHWFNEYPIAFGINEGKLVSYLSENNIDQEKVIVDLGADGISIKSDIPLETVEYVYCWFKNKHSIQEWTKKNCSNAKVISFEALNLMRKYKDVFQDIADSNNLSLSEAWKNYPKISNQT